MRFTLSKLLFTATAMSAVAMFASASAQAGLTFTPVVASVVENATAATITVDVFGQRDQGAQQLLSTYGIRVSSSAGTLTSANSTNAIVQNEWQGFVRQNLPGPSDVVFQGGQPGGTNSLQSIDISLTSSRIGQAVFTVLKTNAAQLITFSLSAGPTLDAPGQNGVLLTDNTPGGYTNITPFNLNGTSANVSALAAVPEPSSLVLSSLLLGGIPYGLRRRRRAKARVAA